MKRLLLVALLSVLASTTIGQAMELEFRTMPAFYLGTIKNEIAQEVSMTNVDARKLIATIPAGQMERLNYPVGLGKKDFLKEFKIATAKSEITLTVQHNLNKKNYFDVLLYVKIGILGKSKILSSWSNAANPQSNYVINLILKGNDLTQSIVSVLPAQSSKQATGFEL